MSTISKYLEKANAINLSHSVLKIISVHKCILYASVLWERLLESKLASKTSNFTKNETIYGTLNFYVTLLQYGIMVCEGEAFLLSYYPIFPAIKLLSVRP